MLAGAVSAGDCLRLCDNEFWRKTLPTLDEVQSELNKGTDINGRGFGGQTPLHYASDDMDDASKGNIRNLKQTARELIQREEGALHHFFHSG